MSCFSHLVKSHFLANAHAELRRARFVIMGPPEIDTTKEFYTKTSTTSANHSLVNFYPFSPAIRNLIFEDIWEDFYMDEFLSDPENQELDSMFSVCYMESDLACLIYSRDQSSIDESIQYNYNINGELPFYRITKVLDGIEYHFVLSIRTLPFTPFSVN